MARKLEIQDEKFRGIRENLESYFSAESDLEKARNREVKAIEDLDNANWRASCALAIAEFASKECGMAEAVRNGEIDMIPAGERGLARMCWLRCATGLKK